MIIEALWFFLPAGIANAVPVFAARMPGLKRYKAPLDFGKTYRGKRVFGANKTWRGLLSGMIVATLIIALQKYLFTRNLWVLELAWFDYRPATIWLLGPLFGAGALLADAAESFFKRQKGVPPGESWFPFDQIDYIIGGCLFSLAVVQLAWTKYLLVLVVWFLMHLASSYIGYLLNLKDKPI
jgi:CDP-2,3-bis-(O-geranylgeranyl)-sn-glycerol synthase